MKKTTIIDIIVIVFSLILLLNYQSKELTVEIITSSMVAAGERIEIMVRITGNYEYWKLYYDRNELPCFDDFKQKWDIFHRNLIRTEIKYSVSTNKAASSFCIKNFKLIVVDHDKKIVKEKNITVFNPFNMAKAGKILPFFLT